MSILLENNWMKTEKNHNEFISVMFSEALQMRNNLPFGAEGQRGQT